MISQTAEYALRAVVCLASRPGSPLTTQQIARTTLIPSGYLSKVLQALGRAELVHSYRGLNGGFLLSREPGELSLLDVIRAVDPIQRIRRCPLQIDEHARQLCALHARLDQVMAEAETSFRDTTIGALIADCDACTPLCKVEDDPHHRKA